MASFNPIELTDCDISRFWGKVIRAGSDDCWIWCAAKTEHGYGVFRAGAKNYKAHRVSKHLSGGLSVSDHCCHKCDNPSCVNPSHLFSGTHKQNMEDMVLKGRHSSHLGTSNLPSGDDHWTHKRPELVRRGKDHHLKISPNLAARGERIGISKLKESSVREILLRNRSGEAISQIANEFGVTYQAVYGIVKRRTWKHVSITE